MPIFAGMYPPEARTVVVLGASPNPDRYSYMAVQRLNSAGFSVIPVGLRPGLADGIPIHTDRPVPQHVDTVTLYIGPANQKDWKDYLFSLRPARVIFNPGTDNPALWNELLEAGIEPVEACTLVMLSTGTF